MPCYEPGEDDHKRSPKSVVENAESNGMQPTSKEGHAASCGQKPTPKKNVECNGTVSKPNDEANVIAVEEQIQNGSSNFAEEVSARPKTSKSSSIKPQGNVIRIKSKFKKESYTFVWVYHAFNKLCFVSETPITSKTFCMGKEHNTTWQLQISKEAVEIEDTDEQIMCIAFRLTKPNDQSIWDCAEYSIWIETEDGRSLKCVDNDVTKGGYRDRPIVFKVGDEPKDSDLKLCDIFEEETIKIKCVISYVYMIKVPRESPIVPDESRLSVDLALLQNTPKFSDITICAGGAEFPVHRNILCARSYAFDKMLQDKSTKCRQKIQLEIEDSVAENMLQYMYAGEIPSSISVDECYKLWKAAEIYDVNYLRSSCLTLLNKRLLEENDICDSCDKQLLCDQTPGSDERCCSYKHLRQTISRMESEELKSRNSSNCSSKRGSESGELIILKSAGSSKRASESDESKPVAAKSDGLKPAASESNGLKPVALESDGSESDGLKPAASESDGSKPVSSESESESDGSKSATLGGITYVEHQQYLPSLVAL